MNIQDFQNRVIEDLSTLKAQQKETNRHFQVLNGQVAKNSRRIIETEQKNILFRLRTNMLWGFFIFLGSALGSGFIAFLFMLAQGQIKL